MAPGSIHDGEVQAQTQAAAQERYRVEPLILNDPKNKKLRLACIGAGVSGIMMAYQIQKNLENYELVIYEREEEIGGTWWLNRYPGCACDIPSHAYQYAFALNPDWPNFFSPSANIWSYLNHVCETFGLRKFMHFKSEITRAEWQEESATWKIWINQTGSDGSVTQKIDECDILMHATGVLNKFKWPKIKGLEKFKGKMIHTARWPTEYQEDAWKGERVGVIGSGASSIQTVPNMQPHVKHLDIFIRTPVWFVEMAGNNGENHSYTEEQQKEFREHPEKLLEHAKDLESKINGHFGMVVKGSEMQKQVSEYFRERTKGMFKDKELADKITPKWSLGCRRITPGDPYIMAIQEPNVTCHFTEVVEITETGLVGKNGETCEVDTIVCATGFDTSFRPNFPIVGRNGVVLSEKWAKTPEAYLGLAVPDMPNFFTFIGPTWPIGNGSVMGPLEEVSNYVIKFLKKFQGELIRTFVPKQDVTDEFNEHAQEYLSHTVWSDDCRSWYKDNDTGRVNAIWPGSSLHYIECIERPRYEDYEWTSTRKNRWAFLGQGETKSLTVELETSDKAPYMKMDALDEKWMEELKKEKAAIALRPERKLDEDDVAPNGFAMKGSVKEMPLVGANGKPPSVVGA